MALGTNETIGTNGYVMDADHRLVTVGSNGTSIAGTAGTATLTNVASSASSVTLLSANTARLGTMVYNDSTAIAYVKFGTTASSSSYTVQMPPSTYYELPSPVYTGRIDVIWASANGNARVTEIAA